MTYLLDTNVVSEIRKPSADPRVLSWYDGVRGDELYVSVLVVGEIRRGIERIRRRDSDQAEVYARWLAVLHQRYAGRILPITAEIADEWGRLDVPDPLPVVDGLLAATALVHGLTLVTRNTADFSRTGVRLLDPFR